MQLFSKTLLIVFLASSSLLSAAHEVPSNPKEALSWLMAGNERFANDKLLHPNRSQTRRESLIDTQNPFATVVGCSDSRVSPTLLFDQGVGDIFEVRLAGNVVGPIGIASIEYSAKFLGVSVVMVLGHENCGAVKAVLAGQTQDIEPVANKIQEALAGKNKSDITLEYAIKANVKNVVNEIKANPAIAKLINEKKLEIVGGYYQLQSGKVQLCCD